MITKVRVRYFKQFKDQEFDLSEHIILAGPNNSGKTTLLQAIAVWQLAFKRWIAERGPGSGSKAKKRTGVPITRKDFTALPLREMNLLWTDTITGLKKEELENGQSQGHPRYLAITLEGRLNDKSWRLTFDFRYQNTELAYIRASEEQYDKLPIKENQLDVVHIPPFSGIGADETGHDRPYQDLLIGQGKAGDILRNLLLEVYKNSPKNNWKELCGHIEDILGYRLLPPEYEGKPYILCEYLCGIPKGKGRDGLAKLDIASAGSGFHQVLLLLAFFYARPSTVLLFDEPDAHLHVVLQKQIYDMLRSIAAKRHIQLIIATHAEVLIDNTSPDMILSFFKEPHCLVSDTDRDQVREALKRLTATDVLLAERSQGVLYVEGQTDFDLLREWARILEHPMSKWFSENPFWHNNQGCHPREARGHFFALRAIKDEIRGFLILDGDNRSLPNHEVESDGLMVERWERYEVENYLLHPDVLRRFVASRLGSLFAQKADDYLQEQLPPAVYKNPLSPHDYLKATPASKTLLPEFFRASQIDITKQEYYMIAEQMDESEIPPEIKNKLDKMAKIFKFGK